MDFGSWYRVETHNQWVKDNHEEMSRNPRTAAWLYSNIIKNAGPLHGPERISVWPPEITFVKTLTTITSADAARLRAGVRAPQEQTTDVTVKIDHAGQHPTYQKKGS